MCYFTVYYNLCLVNDIRLIIGYNKLRKENTLNKVNLIKSKIDHHYFLLIDEVFALISKSYKSFIRTEIIC